MIFNSNSQGKQWNYDELFQDATFELGMFTILFCPWKSSSIP